MSRAARANSSVSARRGSRAFTLVELLVVVGILALLAGLVAAVGPKVLATQRRAQTAQILNTLDRALEEYRTDTGSIPKFEARLFDLTPGDDATLTDYRGGRYPKRPDAAVFLYQVRGYAECDAIIAGIPAKLLKLTPRAGAQVDPTDPNQRGVPTPSVLDAWANNSWKEPWPADGQQFIYYVHPENLLAQDLYGRCVNRRPYFMSAGADLMYGLPEQGTKTASALGADPAAGEPTAAFRDRVLRETRANNVYSYPVDVDFSLNAGLMAEWQ